MKFFFRPCSLMASVAISVFLTSTLAEAQCSSDTCTTFDTWGDLVDRVNDPTPVSSEDDNTRTICLCGREYSGDLCTASNTTSDNHDNGMILHVTQPGITVAINCMGLVEQPCIFACPSSSVVVYEKATLHLIGIRSNFVWTSSEGAPTSKVTVESEASLLVSGVKFENIDTFDDNSTQSNALGGAIDISGGLAQIYDSAFINCKASEKGGAIYVGPGAELDFRRGILEGNQAPRGGAIYIDEGVVSARITTSMFHDNLASGSVNATDHDIFVNENARDTVQFCENAEEGGDAIENFGCSATSSHQLWVSLLALGVWTLAML